MLYRNSAIFQAYSSIYVNREEELFQIRGTQHIFQRQAPMKDATFWTELFLNTSFNLSPGAAVLCDSKCHQVWGYFWKEISSVFLHLLLLIDPEREWVDTNGFIWHAGYIDSGILSCKLLLAGAKVFWAGYQVYLVPSLLWGSCWPCLWIWWLRWMCSTLNFCAGISPCLMFPSSTKCSFILAKQGNKKS